eukprot:COSAG06_NODE_461_length_15416_cov_516.842854_3_plen_232_part_00
MSPSPSRKNSAAINIGSMSDEPNAQPAREPTLTSLLASIVRENRPGRTVRLVDPVRTHGHNPLKRAYIYALLDSRGVMRVIGSTRSSLPVRFSCYRSSLRNPQHTTSPLLRYMQRTGDTFDNWRIIAMKTLWYDPMHCEDRIRVEERASMDYYRSIGTPLLNHNSPIDTNDNRRTYMEAWRARHGQGQVDDQGRSLSYSARYCRQWRADRAAAAAAAAAAAQPAQPAPATA